MHKSLLFTTLAWFFALCWAQSPNSHVRFAKKGLAEKRDARLPNDLAIKGTADYNSTARPVYIVSRMVGGPAVSILTDGVLNFLPGSKAIVDGGAPNRLYHWALMVGDYYHQLQATSLDGGRIYYQDKKSSMWDNWNWLAIGYTTMNDEAIQEAGVAAINAMPETYNWRTNNCQNFVTLLATAVVPGAKLPPMSLAARGLDDTAEMDEETKAQIKYAAIAKLQELESKGLTIQTTATLA